MKRNGRTELVELITHLLTTGRDKKRVIIALNISWKDEYTRMLVRCIV